MTKFAHLIPLLLFAAATAIAQPPGGGAIAGGPPPGRGGFNFGATVAILADYDKDKDGRLDAAERQAARDGMAATAAARGPGGFGGPGGFPGRGPAPAPRTAGPRVTPADVKTFPSSVPLYDPLTLRTIFIEFENRNDWEKELESFNNTDVEVPAKVTVDGKSYDGVGVHFRGLSSFMMVPATQKRSLNLSFDYTDQEQNLLGYSTVNLLNSHEDPSFLRSILYHTIAREYLPAPKANLVKVVINGESWGVYVNSQQYNKEFINEWYKTTQGARWKAPGNPGGQANWGYIGDDPALYKNSYTIKSKDDPKDWAKLINVFKVLNETPPDKLEAALAPIFDVDGALRFLALDNALINNDGYWIRASDYVIYKDAKDIIHILPQDANETFAIPAGPGFGGGAGRGPGGPPAGAPGGAPAGAPRGNVTIPAAAGANGPPAGFPQMGPGGPPVNGVELDPFYVANNPNRQLAQKLLAVPALRAKYLAYMRDIATRWLDWNKLGPIARQYHDLIAEEIKADTRKIDSTEDFEKSLTEDVTIAGVFGPSKSIGLKNFADQRRAYLLRVTAP